MRALLLVLLSTAASVAVRAEEASPTRVDEMISALDSTDDATARLARVLETLPGRAAFEEAVGAADERRAAREVRAALRRVAAAPPPHAWSEELAAWTADVDRLAVAVADLRRNLAGADVLTSDLRAFLAREDAARVLHRTLVRPRTRPHELQIALTRCLAADDAGRLHVPGVLRIRSERVQRRDETLVRALARLGTAVPALVEKVRGDAPWRRAFVGLLEDQAGLVALLHAAGAWKQDAEETVEQTVDRLVARLQATDAPLALLARARRLRRSAPDTLRVARAYAARLADDGSLSGWRSLLRSPRALLLSPAGRLEQGEPVDVLLNRTGFGRALVKGKDATWRVNPHAQWDLDRILAALRKEALEAAEADAEVDGTALPEALAGPVGRDLLREIATWEAQGRRVDPLHAWMEESLEKGADGLRIRAAAGPLMGGLLARVPTVERELADAAAVHLDLEALTWQIDAVDLLRSSIFYNPRTGYGHYTYVTQFEDHFAARLFGTFGWNAKVSKDLADFKQRIRAQKKRLQQLARTHDKLIVHMSGVPPWLSSWEGAGTFEAGGWEDKQAHPPRDLQVWKAMIRELALVFREVEGVERYYEFWNEPDLEYWQGSLADFLALYAATVTTIREVDPAGKVGGPAVNQWDGRIHKQTGSDVLVHELIRFAAQEKLPLDFVSWHHFGRPVPAIAEAQRSYAAKLERHGFDPDKMEYLVTEWSAPGRGMPYGNVFHAETTLGFFAARIDAQTAACWEEFHAQPDPKGFPPWGLMTQQGDRHGTWFVHRFFDRLARGSRGVAVVRPADGAEDGPVVVVSRKGDGEIDLLVWRVGMPPPARAAYELLEAAGFTRREGRAYGTLDRFEQALRDGGPAPTRLEEVFATACDAYAAADPGTERLALRIDGASSLQVVFAESIRTEHAVKRVAVLGDMVTCPLARYEVLRLTLRVR